MKIETHVRLFQSPAWGFDSVQAYIYQERGGVRYAVKPITLEYEPIEEGSFQSPSLNIYEEHAQSLMNDLWQIGYRPRNGEGTLAQTKATDSHLQDLRKLVSKAYKVEL